MTNSWAISSSMFFKRGIWHPGTITATRIHSLKFTCCRVEGKYIVKINLSCVSWFQPQCERLGADPVGAWGLEMVEHPQKKNKIFSIHFN